MQSETFPYIEDYIEFIAGLRSAKNKSLLFFEKLECPISLARYDVKIIESLATQTSELNRPYTDKQSELAITLVKKYVKQLNNIGIIIPKNLTNFRYGIRQIDRTKKLYIENDKLILKFPYDTKLLTVVRKYSKESHGRAEFNHDTKLWTLSLTEPMLNWTMALALSNQFEITNEVKDLYDQILAVEKSQYQIKLLQRDNFLYIENGEQSLINHIETNLGGFSKENLLLLVDNAPVLGYEVDQSLRKFIADNYKQFDVILQAKHVTLSMVDFPIDTIIEYAKITNRLPIYFYDTDNSKTDTDQIIYINKKTPSNLEAKLLVTKSPLMIGPKKQSWLSSAEKTIVLI